MYEPLNKCAIAMPSQWSKEQRSTMCWNSNGLDRTSTERMKCREETWNFINFRHQLNNSRRILPCKLFWCTCLFMCGLRWRCRYYRHCTEKLACSKTRQPTTAHEFNLNRYGMDLALQLTMAGSYRHTRSNQTFKGQVRNIFIHHARQTTGESNFYNLFLKLHITNVQYFKYGKNVSLN